MLDCKGRLIIPNIGFLSKIKGINVSRLFFFFSVILFIVISVIALLQHIPWFDEHHAWEIASNVSFFDLFKVTHHEGHMVIWYIILMPFAKNNLYYPYTMQFINLFFMTLSILLMWKFAPFNSLVKSLITLSFPMRWHAYYARCYSIGILFLFAIASLYPKRMQHPFLYAFLIILAANTSVMALMGSFAFGILFLYDLFSNNSTVSGRSIVKILLIFAFGGGAILLQLWKPVMPCYVLSDTIHTVFERFFNFYIGPGYDINHILFTISYLVLLLLSPFFLKKDIQSLRFLYITTLMLMVVFFCFYAPYSQHFSFMPVYFIITMWLHFYAIPDFSGIIRKIYLVLWYIFLFSMIIYPNSFYKFYSFMDLEEYVEQNIELFRDSKIFLFPNKANVEQILPYIEKYHLNNLYNAEGENYRSLDFWLHYWDKLAPDFKAITDTMGEDKTAYLLVDIIDIEELENIYKYENYGLTLIPYKCLYPAIVYIIKK